MVRKKPSVKPRISKTFYTQDRSYFFRFRTKTDPGNGCFLAYSALFLTGQFSGRRCDEDVRNTQSGKTLDLVAFVLGKLDPGESLAWHSLDFEVKEA